jgi:hypothetical protein
MLRRKQFTKICSKAVVALLVLIALLIPGLSNAAHSAHMNTGSSPYPRLDMNIIVGPVSGQAQSYVEDFSSYSHKAYSQQAAWDISKRQAALLPTSGGAHRESSIASDGQGGAYVTWGDLRNNHSNGNWDIYIQRLDSQGNRLWVTDLRANSDTITETYQGIPGVVTDSQDNALVAWIDDREEPHAVYAQKISPNGTKLWSKDVRVNSMSSFRIGWGADAIAIALDSQDNLIVAWQAVWEDNWSTPNVYVQKIRPDGQRQWNSEARINVLEGHTLHFLAVNVDVQGDLVAAWVDDRNNGEDIYAQRLDSNGTRAWTFDVKVSAGISPKQGNPSVIINSQGAAVVVWRSGPADPPLDNDTSTILAQKIDASGVLLWPGNVQINQDITRVFRGHPHAVLAPDDGTLVVWEDTRRGFGLGTVDIQSQLLNADGTRGWPADRRINPDNWRNWNLKPRLGIRGNLAFVTWQTDDDVFAQVLNLSSLQTALPLPAQVNEGDGRSDQVDGDVARLNDHQILVVWQEFRRGTSDIRAQILDLDGRGTWPAGIQINEADVLMKRQRPQVATNLDELSLVVWHDEQGGIYGRLIDRFGSPRWDHDVRVDTHGRRAYYPTVAALSDGSFALTWIEQRTPDSNLWDIYLQHIDVQANRLWVSDVRVNASNYFLSDIDVRSIPIIVVDAAGHLVVVWRGDSGSSVDIFARRFSTAGNPDWPTDVPLNVAPYTLTGRFEDRAVAAVADNEITVAAVAHRDGLYGLYAQRLSLDGQLLWNPGVWVSSSSQEIFWGNPDLALANDGSILAIWDEEPGRRDAWVQRLSPQGVLLWTLPVRLNDQLAWPLHPALSAQVGTSFVAVWNDERFGDNSIYARRFTADGSLIWAYDQAAITEGSFYYSTGTVESATIDNTPDNIAGVSLIVQQTYNGGAVDYYLSNDGGQTWEEAVPGQLHAFNSVGSNLRWKAVLHASGDHLRSPIITRLTIRYGPDVIGDAYEPDDTCAEAQPVITDGTSQQHIFHDQADTDWTVFNVISGTTYLIEAQVPTGSPVDLAAELRNQCLGLPLQVQNFAFTRGIRFQYEASSTSSLYLKLLNHNPTIYGPQVAYQLSVRVLSAASAPGALILVAGRLRVPDDLQANINHSADQIYQLFLRHGYSDDRVYYLSTDLARPGVDALPSLTNLQGAITSWSLDRTGPDRPLTLYLIDHGDYDRFYLDKPHGEWVTPQQVNDWLTFLEASVPGVKVNVIIETCQSGSFIDPLYSVSGPGRVVVASTSSGAAAYASSTGALFSDYLLDALNQDKSLYSGFRDAQAAVSAAHLDQTPWLDDNGNGIPNESSDGQEAAQRGFAYLGTLSGDAWPPLIAQAEGPSSIIQGQGGIRAKVFDDIQVKWVWAVIYAPSYQPPLPGEEWVREPAPTIMLQLQGDNWYAATYTGFVETGAYRVVIYAEDGDGFKAQPQVMTVQNGWAVRLPLIIR